MSKEYSEIGPTATTVQKSADGYTRVIYQDTVVVAFNDKEIVLNNGGYQTLTTKARMNQTSQQFDLEFLVSGSCSNYRQSAKEPWKVHFKGREFTFENKMMLNRNMRQKKRNEKKS